MGDATWLSSPVPLTLEGSYVLHQMFRFRRTAWRQEESFIAIASSSRPSQYSKRWRAVPPSFHISATKATCCLFTSATRSKTSISAELAIAQTELADFLEPVHSYLSVVELGLYESSAKTYAELAAKGFAAPFGGMANGAGRGHGPPVRRHVVAPLPANSRGHDISASIRWIAAAAKLKTGTRYHGRAPAHDA